MRPSSHLFNVPQPLLPTPSSTNASRPPAGKAELADAAGHALHHQRVHSRVPHHAAARHLHRRGVGGPACWAKVGGPACWAGRLAYRTHADTHLAPPTPLPGVPGGPRTVTCALPDSGWCLIRTSICTGSPPSPPSPPLLLASGHTASPPAPCRPLTGRPCCWWGAACSGPPPRAAGGVRRAVVPLTCFRWRCGVQ